MRKMLVFLFLVALFVVSAQAQVWNRITGKDSYNAIRAMAAAQVVGPITEPIYFVDPLSGSSTNSGLSPEEAMDNISTAYDACLDSTGATIIIFSNGRNIASNTSKLTTAITWAKWGITVIGAAAPTMFSQRARIGSGDALGGDTLAYLINVTGSNNAFYNLHIINEGDSTEAIGALQVEGNRNYFRNVHVFGAVGAAASALATAKSLYLNGGAENTFKDCVFGSNTMDRTAAAMTAEVWIDGACYRNTFRDCQFHMSTNDADHGFIRIVDATALNNSLTFRDCDFVNFYANLGISTMTTAFVGENPNTGIITLRGCLFAGPTDIAPSAWDNVVTADPAADAAGGISVYGE